MASNSAMSILEAMHQSAASQLARPTPKLHASKILIALLLATTKKSVRLINVKVTEE